jgi:hypothetical protein
VIFPLAGGLISGSALVPTSARTLRKSSIGTSNRTVAGMKASATGKARSAPNVAAMTA